MNPDEMQNSDEGLSVGHAGIEAAASERPKLTASPWTVKNLLVLLCCAFLALLAANFLATTGYMLIAPASYWKRAPEALRYDAIFNSALVMIFHVLFTGVIYLFLVVNHGLPFWQTLAWRRISARAAGICALAGVAMAILIQFAPPLLPSTQDYPLQKMFNSPASGYTLAAFAILIAPFMEELIFRGLLFAFFEKMAGVPLAVVGTAGLFAALHVSQYWGAWNHVALLTLVGICFSAVRGATGSVTPSFVLHTTYNATLIAGLFWQTHFFHSFPGHLGR
jgi:membrane protease YdiL (CAAX protease family)